MYNVHNKMSSLRSKIGKIMPQMPVKTPELSHLYAVRRVNMVSRIPCLAAHGSKTMSPSITRRDESITSQTCNLASARNPESSRFSKRLLCEMVHIHQDA